MAPPGYLQWLCLITIWPERITPLAKRSRSQQGKTNPFRHRQVIRLVPLKRVRQVVPISPAPHIWVDFVPCDNSFWNCKLLFSSPVGHPLLSPPHRCFVIGFIGHGFTQALKIYIDLENEDLLEVLHTL